MRLGPAQALVARGAYAERWGLPYYLWLGAVDDGFAAPDCDARDAEVALKHVVKVLAVLRVLALRTCGDAAEACEAVLYADLDTLPSLEGVDGARYLALAPEADLVASSNVNKPVLMNGGLFLLRNTAWARAFLVDWWRRRCGPHDQLPLWRALFATWADAAPDLADPGLLANYSVAHAAALPALAAARAKTWPALKGTSWACAPKSRCGRYLARKGCVPEPALVGKVLLLPVQPFADGRGAGLPPLQGAGLGTALFCHKTCPGRGEGRSEAATNNPNLTRYRCGAPTYPPDAWREPPA